MSRQKPEGPHGAVDRALSHDMDLAASSYLALVNRVSMAISSAVDLDKIWQTTAQELTSALSVDGCAISTWDRELDVLVTRLDYWPNPGPSQPRAEGTVRELADHPGRSRKPRRQPTLRIVTHSLKPA